MLWEVRIELALYWSANEYYFRVLSIDVSIGFPEVVAGVLVTKPVSKPPTTAKKKNGNDIPL